MDEHQQDYCNNTRARTYSKMTIVRKKKKRKTDKQEEEHFNHKKARSNMKTLQKENCTNKWQEGHRVLKAVKG